jgi:uncharacterized membrane protein
MKIARLFFALIILVMVLSVFSLTGIALAQDEASPNDIVTMSTQYPKIDGLATDTFQFNVNMNYTGATDRVFELTTSAPQNWDVTITPLYDTSKKISSTSLAASTTGVTQALQITARYTTSTWILPDPGEYTITLQASSGSLATNIALIAKVTARYSLYADTSDSLYSLKAKSNKDTILSITVMNNGTAKIDNISFTSDKTQGWSVTFKPEKIDSLASLESLPVEVNVKPAAKTISGDYMLNIYITGDQAKADKMAIRVTVETPTIWGWVGVIIIVIVVVGLIGIFMRFGRR